jgi:tRNA nucleotidyltransferase (CCA-adding enzyme)
MEVFICGGAVRDVIMGHEPKDIDFVVVGSTPAEMIANGFKQVGVDFPVFLHPKTGEEWALARTERKISVGYNGFTCETTDVTLIQDLSRRDLSCNSMAVRIEDWAEFKNTKSAHLVIDPFWGQADIHCGILIHTSEAFSEDPIRVLRVSRFAARYNFAVAPETMQLMSDIVHELDHVPTERIWMEFEKGLMEDHSHRMIEVLHEVGAFHVKVMQPFNRAPDMWQRPSRSDVLKKAVHIKHLPSRFALIGTGFTKDEFKTHRIPNDCADISLIINKHVERLAFFHVFNKAQRLNIIMELRAIQRPVAFLNQVFDVVDILFDVDCTIHRDKFFQDIKDISRVDAAVVAEKAKKAFNPNDIWSLGTTIQNAIFNARLDMMDVDKRNWVVSGQ